MSLETATYLNALVETWPDGASDNVAQGDDHIRLLKATIKRTFPNIAGEISVSAGEVNLLDGGAEWLSISRSAGAVTDITIAKNATFTGSGPKVSANPANWYWVDTGAAANQGRWRIGATAETFVIQTRSDDNSTGVSFIEAAGRSGNTVASLGFVATTVTTNGIALVSSTTPRLRLYDSNAGANAKYTEFNGNSGFVINLLDDSAANPVTALSISRTGTTVDNIAAEATVLSLAGAQSWSNISTTTSAPSAGGAGALPATPAGYVTVSINGVSRKLAYY